MADSANVSQLLFANKTRSDLKLLQRFNGVAALIELIESDDRWKERRETSAYAAANRGYITVPTIVEVTRATPADGNSSGDFSPGTIAALAEQGEKDASAKLGMTTKAQRRDSSRAFG